MSQSEADQKRKRTPNPTRQLANKLVNAQIDIDKFAERVARLEGQLTEARERLKLSRNTLDVAKRDFSAL